MKTNFSQAKGWLTSAINDIKRVLSDLNLKDFSRAAFRSQFAVEKLNKTILSFMGIKIEKTHTPSEILKKVLRDESVLSLNEETKDLIKYIIRTSEFFERHGTKTRYGVIEEDKIRFPEEIYGSFKDIKSFIENLVYMINLHTILMEKTFNLSLKKFEPLKLLKGLEGELNKWI